MRASLLTHGLCGLRIIGADFLFASCSDHDDRARDRIGLPLRTLTGRAWSPIP